MVNYNKHKIFCRVKRQAAAGESVIEVRFTNFYGMVGNLSSYALIDTSNS